MDSNNRGKGEEKKCNWGCGRKRKDCPIWSRKCVQGSADDCRTNDISDDDFVENPYGYGLGKKKDDVQTPETKSKAKTKTKTQVSTSSVVTEPSSSTSDDDFVPCTFKTGKTK